MHAARIALVRGERKLLDKTVHVYGDVDDRGAPRPFMRMPLVYARAFGGPDVPENPAGTRWPNLVDPSQPRRPAGFGPVSRRWPIRARHLYGLDAAALAAPVPSLPDPMPWDYYQAAPDDQQIEYLQGGEWLLLQGLHPLVQELRSQLPRVRAAVRIVRRSTGRVERDLSPVADRLIIEADSLRVSVVWRAVHEVGDEHELGDLLAMAGLEWPQRGPDWDVLGRGELAASGARRPLTATLAVPDHVAAQAKQVAPFSLPPPGSSVRPLFGAEGTPWGGAPIASVPPAFDDEITLTLGASGAKSPEPAPATRHPKQLLPRQELPNATPPQSPPDTVGALMRLLQPRSR
jgi:hypothetical protein